MAQATHSNTAYDTVLDPTPDSVAQPIGSIDMLNPVSPYVATDSGSPMLNVEAGIFASSAEQLHAHIAHLTAMVHHLLDRVRHLEGKKAPAVADEPLLAGNATAAQDAETTTSG